MTAAIDVDYSKGKATNRGARKGQNLTKAASSSESDRDEMSSSEDHLYEEVNEWEDNGNQGSLQRKQTYNL